MPEQENTDAPQTPATDKNKYAHVIELARAKKATRGELDMDRRPPQPPSNWSPPSGE